MVNLILYICPIAFQATGSLILIIWCLKNRNETIVNRCFPGGNVIERDLKDNCIIEKEKLQNSAFEVYLNIAAFGDLLIGYILSVFGWTCEKNTSPLQRVTILIVAVVVLLCVEHCVCKKAKERNYRTNMILSYDYLKKQEVDTVLTTKEIDDICQIGDKD